MLKKRKGACIDFAVANPDPGLQVLVFPSDHTEVPGEDFMKGLKLKVKTLVSNFLDILAEHLGSEFIDFTNGFSLSFG